MSIIRVSVEDMERAAYRCRDLAARIEQCKEDCRALNEELQAAWDGQTAQEFDSFVQTTATRVLQECSEMCYNTAQAINHTCQQFTEADTTLSGTFSV